MGFYIRKSFKAGPFRFNLSKSGIGCSVGVKGLRYGIDANGKEYMHAGRYGLYYKEYFDSPEIDTNNSNIESVDSCVWFYIFLLVGMLCIYGQTNNGLAILLPVYYFPTICTYAFKLPNASNTFWLNTLCGWTLFYYIFALMDINKKIGIAQKYKLACFDIEMENYNSAIQKFTELEKEIKNYNSELQPEIRETLFKCYVLGGFYDDALDYLEETPLTNKRHKKLWIYSASEDNENIIKFVQKEYSEEEKENHPLLYAMMGTAFMNIERNDTALTTLLLGPVNKRKMTGEMCGYRYVLGECYEANNMIDEALSQYNKIYAYDIDYKDVSEKIDRLNEIKYKFKKIAKNKNKESDV